jgi:hypothetical protein
MQLRAMRLRTLMFSLTMTLAAPAFANTEAFALHGEGSLRWLGLKIYDARLFASGRLAPERLMDNPFALELTYARDFAGSSIAERSIEEIRKLGAGTPPQHEAWKSAMQRIFPNVRTGDRLRGIHQPGRGATFMLNGQPIGSIDDADFSSAFFAIWLDPRTSEPSLRRSLLRLADSRSR